MRSDLRWPTVQTKTRRTLTSLHKCWLGKNWKKTVFKPVASRRRTLAPGFTVQRVGQPATNFHPVARYWTGLSWLTVNNAIIVWMAVGPDGPVRQVVLVSCHWSADRHAHFRWSVLEVDGDYKKRRRQNESNEVLCIDHQKHWWARPCVEEHCKA